MRCFDILNIPETATVEEIDSAFSARIKNLEKNSDSISSEAFDKKHRELCEAKAECELWKKRSSTNQMQLRIKNCLTVKSDKSKNEVRLYECCIGPFTFSDICLGALCSIFCGADIDESCFHDTCGNQIIPALADVGFYVYQGQKLLKKKKEKAEAEEQAARVRKAKQARGENEFLLQRIERCRTKRAEIESEYNSEINLQNQLNAFGNMFATLGAVGIDCILEHQMRQVAAVHEELKKNTAEETSLQSKIQNNQKLIDAAGDLDG